MASGGGVVKARFELQWRSRQEGWASAEVLQGAADERPLETTKNLIAEAKATALPVIMFDPSAGALAQPVALYGHLRRLGESEDAR